MSTDLKSHNRKWYKAGIYRVHHKLPIWIRLNANSSYSVMYRLFDEPLILTYHSEAGWAQFTYQSAVLIAAKLERQLERGVLRVA